MRDIGSWIPVNFYFLVDSFPIIVNQSFVLDSAQAHITIEVFDFPMLLARYKAIAALVARSCLAVYAEPSVL